MLLEPLFHPVTGASTSPALRPAIVKRSAEQSKPGQRLLPAQWFVGGGTGDHTAVSRGSSACMRLADGVLCLLLHWFKGTRRMKALAGGVVSSSAGGAVPAALGSPKHRLRVAPAAGASPESSVTSPSAAISTSTSSAVLAAARLKKKLQRKRSNRQTVLRAETDASTSHAESHERLMMVREAVAGVSTLAAYSAAVRGMLGMGRPIVLNLPEGRFQGEASAVNAALSAFARVNLAADALEKALKPATAQHGDVGAGAEATAASSDADRAMDRLAAARTAAAAALRRSRATATAAVSHGWPVNLEDLCQAVRDLSREESVIVNGVRVGLRSREAIAGLVLVLTAAVTGSADFVPGLVAAAEAEAAVAAAIESPQTRARRLAAEAKAASRGSKPRAQDEIDVLSDDEDEEGGPLTEAELVQLVARAAVALRGNIEAAAKAAAASAGSMIRRRRMAHADGAARMVSDILVAATRTHSGGDALEVVFGTLMAPGLVTVAAEPAGSSECEILTAGHSAVRVISTNSFRLMGINERPTTVVGVGGVGDLAGTRQGFSRGFGSGGSGTMEQLLAAGPGSPSYGGSSSGGRVTPGLIGIIRTTMEERLEYVSEAEICRAHSLPERMRVVFDRGLVDRGPMAAGDASAAEAAVAGGQMPARGMASSRTPRAAAGSSMHRASPDADKSRFRSAGGILASRKSVSSGSPPETAAASSHRNRSRGGSMLDPSELGLQRAQSGSQGGGLTRAVASSEELSSAASVSSSGSPDKREDGDFKARIRGVGSSGHGEAEAAAQSFAAAVRSHKSIGSRFRNFLGLGSRHDSNTAVAASSPSAARLGLAQRTGDWDAVLGSDGAEDTALRRRASWGIGSLSRGDSSASSALEASTPGGAREAGGAAVDEDDDVGGEQDEEAVELGRLLATVIDAATHGSVTSLLQGVTRSPLRAVRVTRTLRITFVDRAGAAAPKAGSVGLRGE